MRTLKITIAYDGTDFAGWQRQARERTVQAVIEDALQPIEGERVAIVGAGRTDAGVHAASQVASFSLQSAIASRELQRALNATLPQDVRVWLTEDVASGFNARFHARTKIYRYCIWNGDAMPPMLRRFAWHVPQPLEMVPMQQAADFVLGEHDFAAFQATGSDVKSTRRTITSSTISTLQLPDLIASCGPGALICYEVAGSGFLRHMVRNLVGTLVDIGRGRFRAGAMEGILTSRDRAEASATAPARGLTLWRVEY